MKKQITLIPLVAGISLASLSSHGAILVSESFDYGNTTADIDTVSNYVTGSNVVVYDSSTNLSTVALADTVGGSILHDFEIGNRTGTSTDFAINPFPTAGAGDEFWIAGLLQANNLDGTTLIRFNNTQSVNTWGFGFDGAGNVLLYGSDNGGAASTTGIDTGADLVADGSTYLFLSRITLGTGTSPSNSTIDFWFNPSDISSVGALGSATFSTGADSKIGRDSGAYDSIAIGLAFGNRADGIAMSDTLASVPEPSQYAIAFGLLALGFAYFRRRRS